jgi:hypothetical protein
MCTGRVPGRQAIRPNRAVALPNGAVGDRALPCIPGIQTQRMRHKQNELPPLQLRPPAAVVLNNIGVPLA